MEKVWRRLIALTANQSHEPSMHSSSKSNTSDNISFEYDDNAALEQYLAGNTQPISMVSNIQNKGSETDIEILLETFDPIVMPHNTNIIEYWQSVQKEHPELYQLAIIIYMKYLRLRYKLKEIFHH